MREPALPERRAANLDASGRARPLTAGKKRVHHSSRLAIEKGLQPKLRCPMSDDPLGRLPNESLTGAVHQAQRTAFVEGEDGDVDLLHDLAQERAGFEGPQSLIAQRIAQRV